MPDSGHPGAWGRLKEPLRGIFSIKMAASHREMAICRYLIDSELAAPPAEPGAVAPASCCQRPRSRRAPRPRTLRVG